MDEGYWQARWREGRIGFHEGAPNHWLVAHAAVLGITPERRRVLVPLCGKTVDLAFLAARGAEVVGVELVESAARAFFEEAGLPVARTVDGPLVRLEAAGIEIVVGDFLALGPSDVGRFDAFYDRAAIVALPASLRERYARALVGLLADDATGLVATFEHDADDGAPPFSVPEAELRRLFPELVLEPLGSTPDTRPVWKERGASSAIERAFAARRAPR